MSELLGQVKDEQGYIVVRERTHRNTAESTNSRVKWWSIFQVGVLVGEGFFQVWWLKRFFEVSLFLCLWREDVGFGGCAADVCDRLSGLYDMKLLLRRMFVLCARYADVFLILCALWALGINRYHVSMCDRAHLPPQ